MVATSSAHSGLRPVAGKAGSSGVRIVACCLGALALSLVAVGAVSGTVVRHLVQIAPVLLAAVVVSGLPGLGAAASLPIFATWLALMAVIWLYLLGIATFLRGTFTPFELCMTALIGASCILGGIAAVRLEAPSSPYAPALRPPPVAGKARSSVARRIVAAAAFAALQFAALWLSFRPAISRD